jgi:tetratricopeptide (TPR) repeat protein
MARTILATLVLVATAAALFLVGGSSRAGCLWDSDTLRAEAAGAPGLVETIVGRFDRYPPLYYQMRLDRAAEDIASDPTNLAAYDDAAVSCDRLGKHDEAIAWMARKRVALDAMPDSEERTEHEYRYLANLGTFHAHRWLANGADRADMADMERARDLIAQAIALNPDAHFGRERYQLLALDWILQPPARDQSDSSPVSILEIDPNLPAYEGTFQMGDLEGQGYDDAAIGFAGLVSLGNGWNSFDVFLTLGGALQGLGDSSIGTLAWLRAQEIARAGGQSLHPSVNPGAFEPVFTIHSNVVDAAPLERFYTKARAEADAWHAARTAYITARLEQGQHPDTHPAFFAAWAEPSTMPALPNGFFGHGGHTAQLAPVALVVLGLLLFLLVNAVASVVWLIRRIKRRRARRAASPTIAPA